MQFVWAASIVSGIEPFFGAKLLQAPVEELKVLRTTNSSWSGVEVPAHRSSSLKVSGRQLELKLVLVLPEGGVAFDCGVNVN